MDSEGTRKGDGVSPDVIQTSQIKVLSKGKVEDKFPFNSTGTAIPTISEKPVKSLGEAAQA